MQFYETEEQQVEAIKKWWQANGRMVLVGAALGVAVIVGVNLWLHQRKDQSMQASAVYHELLRALEAGQPDAAKPLAARMQNEFAATDYALFGGLFSAALAVGGNDLAAARQALEKVAAGGNQELAHVARIRLLRLLKANGDYEQGLKLINGLDPATFGRFASLYDELVGDMYLGLGRPDQARTAYQSALDGGSQSPLLQMKIDDLAVPEKAAP